MSLYHMAMGVNPMAPRWLAILETHPDIYGRWRDAWLEDRTGELRIIVLTRCGGGNRPDYEAMFEEIKQHPLYIEDYDDDYDSTYALIAFKIPEEGKDWFDEFLQYAKNNEPDKYPVILDNRSLKERFEHAMQKISAGGN